MSFHCLLTLTVWWKISHRLCLLPLSVTCCFVRTAFSFPSYLIVRSLIVLGMIFFIFILFEIHLSSSLIYSFSFYQNLNFFIHDFFKYYSSSFLSFPLLVETTNYKLYLLIFSHSSLNLSILFIYFFFFKLDIKLIHIQDHCLSPVIYIFPVSDILFSFRITT